MALNPVTTAWFEGKIGSPTPVQRETWQAVDEGRHVLAVAPTGSGKTLAAFLVALDRLFNGQLETGGLKVLYISPLKALGTDIRENLTGPLRELQEAYIQKGMADVPEIRVGIRNGDTTPAQRRRQIERPPEILVTTPESLNILLLSEGGRAILSTTRICILDEIHAVAPSRRGTLLSCALERLTDLAGEVQRIGLTATVSPVEKAAAFLGGYGNEARKVLIVNPESRKNVRIRLEKLPVMGESDRPDADGFWMDIAQRLKKEVRERRSTLIFIDSRKWCEKMARFINEGESEVLAWAHHGSLSRDMRRLVETRLKDGELKAVVATGSLELGIDIGPLDEVMMLGCPGSTSTVLQRAGRAGHRPGETSLARIFPITRGDLLAGTVAADMACKGEIEELKIPENPLDVLAQVILACCVEKGRTEEELWKLVRRAWSFRNLPKESFDSVLAMLKGRFAETRIAALKSRLYMDNGFLNARPGTRMLLYSGGGAIPDLGMYTVRQQGTKGSLGSLDEKFVWESQTGAVFHLGNRRWRITGIDDREVIVVPTGENVTTEPFWRAEGGNRDKGFAGRMAEFLEDSEMLLVRGDEELIPWLGSRWNLEDGPATELSDYLKNQRRRGGGTLPHRHLVVAEAAADPDSGADPGSRTLFLHTFLGGQVNRPLALALQSAWGERSPVPAVPTVTDDTIAFTLPDTDIEDFVKLMYSISSPERLIRRVLESTPFFGGRFREAAGRSLLLPASTPRRRQPLWMTRQRSRMLLEAVAGFPDFPLITEVWRSCLNDEFDMAALDVFLGEIRDGTVTVKVVRTPSPSPFADSAVRRRLAQRMTSNMQDQSDARFVTGLQSGEITRLTRAGTLRPRIPAALKSRLDARRRRVEPGYAPGSVEAFKAWIAEREAFDQEDWIQTLASVSLETGFSATDLEAAVSSGIRSCRFGPLEAPWIVVAERADEWIESFGGREAAPDMSAAGQAAGFWLSGRGPVELGRFLALFGLPEDSPEAGELLRVLAESPDEKVVMDRISEGDGPGELCDSEGLEILLRWRRRASRNTDMPLSAERLPAFLAIHQGLTSNGSGEEGVLSVMARLEGYPAPASLWENSILPSRIVPYRTMDLDNLVVREELIWVGAGNHQITFLTAEGGWRYPAPSLPDSSGAGYAADTQVFPGPGDPPAGFWDIAGRLSTDSAAATAAIWNRVWEGRLTCGDMGVLRRGTLAGFRAPPVSSLTGRGGRPAPGGLTGWRSGRPVEGRWHAPGYAEEPDDPFVADRLVREQIRLLLRRYGLLSRPLLEREISRWRWPVLSRTLSLMELGDELIGGRWFEGLPMPQFMAPESLKIWRDGAEAQKGWCIDAADPASICGTGLDENLPPRRDGTWIAWDGRGELLFHLQPGTGELHLREKNFQELCAGHTGPLPDTAAALEKLAVLLLERAVSPLKRLVIRSVRGAEIQERLLKRLLEEAGFTPNGTDDWIRRPRPIGRVEKNPPCRP